MYSDRTITDYNYYANNKSIEQIKRIVIDAGNKLNYD